MKKRDGHLHDLGPYDGGVYLYDPALGHSVSMAELFKEFLNQPILIEEKVLKTRRKIIFTVKIRKEINSE